MCVCVCIYISVHVLCVYVYACCVLYTVIAQPFSYQSRVVCKVLPLFSYNNYVNFMCVCVCVCVCVHACACAYV